MNEVLLGMDEERKYHHPCRSISVIKLKVIDVARTSGSSGKESAIANSKNLDVMMMYGGKTRASKRQHDI